MACNAPTAVLRALIPVVVLPVVVLSIGCTAIPIDLGERGTPVPVDPATAPVADGAPMLPGTGDLGSDRGTVGAMDGPSDAAVPRAPVAEDAGGVEAGPMSLGCGSSSAPTGDLSISVGAASGTYLVDLPTGYDSARPYPVVLAFRGSNVSAEMFRGYLGFSAVVGANALVVTPDCLNGAPTWILQRDLPLFDALMVRIASDYCIDPERVFAFGHGTGAEFTNELGCLRGDALRAIASISGGPPLGPCQGEVAAWIAQGNEDIRAAGGRASRDFWLQQGGCDPTSTAGVEPSPCVAYAGCLQKRNVYYCEYDGGLGLPDFAAPAAWSFFEAL